MPAVVWIAIAVAIVIMGIGGAVAIPQIPEVVVRPVVEKSVNLVGPLTAGFLGALLMAGAVCAYMKLTKKGGQ